MHATSSHTRRIRRRLLERCRAQGNDMATLLRQFARERYAYRLSQTAERSDWVVRGAAVLPLWLGDTARMTRGLDLIDTLGRTPAALQAAVQAAAAAPAETDGLVFLPDSLQLTPCVSRTGYREVRLDMVATLGRLQTDIAVHVSHETIATPPPEEAVLPCMLDLPGAPLRIIGRERYIADKFERCLGFEMDHQRMEDLYDMAMLVQKSTLQGSRLIAAITTTLEKRMTTLPADLPAFLEPQFARHPIKTAQWRHFQRTNRLAEGMTFAGVVTALQMFFMTPLELLARRRTFTQTWTGGMWQ